MLARALVFAAVAWPLVAGVAVWQRVSDGGAGGRTATLVYLAASRVCHQRPERSFSTGGVTWPVCARCAGLYLAAPLAALLAVTGRRRRRWDSRPATLRLVAIAAVPTALTLLWEWGGMGMPPNAWRFVTALPLGAVITYLLIREAGRSGAGSRSDTLTGHGSHA